MSDPFKKLQPGDGFKVERVDLPVGLPTSVSLFISAFQAGERVTLFDAPAEEGVVEIQTWPHAEGKDFGDASRLQHVLEALCRYLTIGGDWDQLTRAMDRIRQLVPGGLVFPGYHLLDSYVTDQGGHEHIFVKDGTTKAVLWVEGEFIERKTLEEIRREQEEAGWGEEGQTGEAASPDQLLLEEDPGDTGSDHEGDRGGVS